jgi:hypothetical protein
MTTIVEMQFAVAVSQLKAVSYYFDELPPAAQERMANEVSYCVQRMGMKTLGAPHEKKKAEKPATPQDKKENKAKPKKSEEVPQVKSVVSIAAEKRREAAAAKKKEAKPEAKPQPSPLKEVKAVKTEEVPNAKKADLDEIVLGENGLPIQASVATFEDDVFIPSVTVEPTLVWEKKEGDDKIARQNRVFEAVSQCDAFEYKGKIYDLRFINTAKADEIMSGLSPDEVRAAKACIVILLVTKKGVNLPLITADRLSKADVFSVAEKDGGIVGSTADHVVKAFLKEKAVLFNDLLDQAKISLQ